MVNSMSDIGSINIELDSIESSPLLARVSDSLIKCLIHSHGLSKVVHSKRVLCIVYGIHFLYMWYVRYVMWRVIQGPSPGVSDGYQCVH